MKNFLKISTFLLVFSFCTFQAERVSLTKEEFIEFNTMLLDAVQNNDVEKARAAIDLGASPDIYDSNTGMTALMWSILTKSKDVFNLLIPLLKSKIDAVNSANETALHFAIRWEESDYVAQLIKAGASVKIADKYGDTPLHYAVRWGNKDLVAMLMQAGADVNALNKKKKTPFDWAIEKENMDDNQIDIIAMLMEAGAKSLTPLNHLDSKILNSAIEKINKKREEYNQTLQMWSHMIAGKSNGSQRKTAPLGIIEKLHQQPLLLI